MSMGRVARFSITWYVIPRECDGQTKLDKLRYLVAIISGLVVFACFAIVVDRFPGLQTDLAKVLLLLVSAAVVIAVSKPWTAGIRRPNSPARLAAAWLATIACVILVLLVGVSGAVFYGIARTP
jgi:divalent metal cation (Fe/Co/Zn/Cd) transporter